MPYAALTGMVVGGSYGFSESRKPYERRSRSRGRSILWGDESWAYNDATGPGLRRAFGMPGYDNTPGQAPMDWEGMLQNRFALEEESLRGHERQARSQFRDYHTAQGARQRTSEIDRGMTGQRAARIHRRGQQRDLQRGYEDISARMAPLYNQMYRSRRAGMSELYRNQFSISTGIPGGAGASFDWGGFGQALGTAFGSGNYSGYSAGATTGAKSSFAGGGGGSLTGGTYRP